MSGWRRTTAACDRAARLISLELDGELGKRERAVLDRHLAACPECTRLKETTRTFTTILRLASKERPTAPVSIPERAVSTRTRSPRALASVVALAALAAIAATLFTVPRSHPATSWSSVALAERVRLVEAEIVPLQDQSPLDDNWTTTPLPAQPFPACSLGCWPSTNV